MPRKKRVTRILSVVLPIVGVGCAIAFAPWSLLWAWLAPLPDTVQEQLEAAAGQGLDGIIFYVDRKGAEPRLYSAGWKDRDARLAADPHALFKIASISKLYIAAAAAKLAHESRLSLDATLSAYLPELEGRVANADRITLRQMLQHRSGISNFTDQPNFPWDNPPKSNRDALAFILDKPADFEPDSRFRYSNTNYVLIAEIIDRALGRSHRDYIKAAMLQPLKLERTYGQLSDTDINEVMSGYFVGYPRDIKGNDYALPGGSMVATAQDVGVFLRSLVDGSLLSQEEQAIYSSIYSYEHTGLLPGYQSIARYHPDMDVVVVQFVSTTGGDANGLAGVLYNRLVRILRKEAERAASDNERSI